MGFVVYEYRGIWCLGSFVFDFEGGVKFIEVSFCFGVLFVFYLGNWVQGFFGDFRCVYIFLVWDFRVGNIEYIQFKVFILIDGENEFLRWERIIQLGEGLGSFILVFVVILYCFNNWFLSVQVFLK